MPITISPLELLLDTENPRFVVLQNPEQSDIRKYLVTYEDVCSLSAALNSYGGILPGERVVALKQGGKYTVIEGNRRTCSLQLLLDPTLIPEGFQHRIPAASDKLKISCQTIEIDLVPSREAALELMTKRHIEGVKQWKPFAKKQFSASNYAAGQSVSNLSRITGMREGDIKTDIRDYKFFLAAYSEYCIQHPEYQGQIVNLKIEPFLRIFKAKFFYNGVATKPVDALKISYTDDHQTTSGLPQDVFVRIVQAVFNEACISERITTRHTLADVTGVITLLNAALSAPNTAPGNPSPEAPASDGPASGGPASDGPASGGPASDGPASGGPTSDVPAPGGPAPGGPAPGGPAPRTFFESLSWSQKLSPRNPDHYGLLAAVNELYNLSTIPCGRKKAYEVFPVATGMILRTAYEQTLKLRLHQTNLWGAFMETVPKNRFPTLSGMEEFIDNPANKVTVLPTPESRRALSNIIRYNHREFLNANIHSPGDICVTGESLSGIAQSGMFTLIQKSINLI